MSQPLTIKMKIRNRAGEIIGEKEVVSYAGLLARAHEQGLTTIETAIVQAPTDANGQTAIVRAVVRGERGEFTGIGDADPSNVNPRVAAHLLRLAETRAKARALRDYTNIGMVSLEELGGDELDEEPSPAPVARPDDPMTDAQRRMLWRQALALGHEGEDAARFIREQLGLEEGEKGGKRAASRLIDQLEQQLRHRGNASRPHG